MWSPTADSTSFRTTPRSPSTTTTARRAAAGTGIRARMEVARRSGAVRRESVEPVYPAAGSNIAADGRDISDWRGGLYATAGVGAATGRLSDDSGAHVLSRREPRCDGHHGYG